MIPLQFLSLRDWRFRLRAPRGGGVLRAADRVPPFLLRYRDRYWNKWKGCIRARIADLEECMQNIMDSRMEFLTALALCAPGE